MPQYDYNCRKCEHQWTLVRSMKNAPPTRGETCPACGNTDGRRLFKAPEVIQDTYENPVSLNTLRPVRTDNPRVLDVVHSRSEHKRLLKQHDAKYGTKLEFAG